MFSSSCLFTPRRVYLMILRIKSAIWVWIRPSSLCAISRIGRPIGSILWRRFAGDARKSRVVSRKGLTSGVWRVACTKSTASRNWWWWSPSPSTRLNCTVCRRWCEYWRACRWSVGNGGEHGDRTEQHCASRGGCGETRKLGLECFVPGLFRESSAEKGYQAGYRSCPVFQATQLWDSTLLLLPRRYKQSTQYYTL